MTVELVIVPLEHGGVVVCDLMQLANAVADGEEDPTENTGIDQTVRMGERGDQEAVRMIVAVRRNNFGGDYWDDSDYFKVPDND